MHTFFKQVIDSLTFQSLKAVVFRKAHSIVEIHREHNHPTLSSEALNKRDVSSETRNRLLELFATGVRPTAAVNIIKADLKQTATDDAEYALLSADRALVPDVGYANRYVV